MLNFTHITLRRGSRVLLQEFDLTVHRGQCLGLTGANGTGKSSLLALIRGELASDEGDVQIQGNTTIAHVAQETPALNVSAVDYTLDGDAELRDIQKRIESSTCDQEYSALMGELETLGGYDAQSRAARLLNGLGFAQSDLNKPVCDFSGGWRMRLNLAQALMCRSDLLLLDEPTNHLDMDAILWLEKWLKQYQGAVIIISHDRDFLDSICSHIVHVEHCKGTLYTGNYSQFEVARATAMAQQQSAYLKQQRDIAHLQSFITRFKAKATKAKQAQSRIKMLERMEKIAPAHIDSPFHFEFFKPEKDIQHLVNFNRISLGYEHPILNEVRLQLINEQRIGLLGLNGAGKSTLIKSIAGTLPVLAGESTLHPDCVVGYFAQHQLDQLIAAHSPLDHLFALDKALNPQAQATEQEMRDYLGGFGFQGDRVYEPIAPFSGGEKARLALALLVYKKPNLLLLDEPTNHLDLDMRHALNMALQTFEGAVVLVSHDRHLMRSVCDTLYIVHNGSVHEFDQEIATYPQWIEEHTNPTQIDNKPQRPSIDKKLKRQQEAEQRAKLKPLKDAVAKHEKTIAKLEAEITHINQTLSDEQLYTDESRKTELQNLIKQQGQLKNDLEQAEAQWLEASEALETALT